MPVLTSLNRRRQPATPSQEDALIDGNAFVPTSIVLQRLHDEAPADHFTLAWLMGSLGRRSFGIIMLLLGLVAP